MNTCSVLSPGLAEIPTSSPLRHDELNVPMSEYEVALTNSPLGQLRRLVVVSDDTQVVITGRVSSYYLKQMAQETVRPVLGPRRLVNRVEVSPEAN